jgi:hypothetical protein
MLDVLMNILTSCRCLASPGAIYDAFHHKLDTIVSEIMSLVKRDKTRLHKEKPPQLESVGGVIYCGFSKMSSRM